LLEHSTEIGRIPPLWDGRASGRIIASLIEASE
jgi:hypothetical protein